MNFVFLNIEISLFINKKKVMVLMVCIILYLLFYMIWFYYILGLKDCLVLCKGIYIIKLI